MFLRRNRMPDQMSGLMTRFFANFIPIIAVMWALDSLLVFRILYREVFYINNLVKIIPNLVCIAVLGLCLLLPIRTWINSCFKGDQAMAEKTYDEVFADFISDYDMENPVTKN